MEKNSLSGMGGISNIHSSFTRIISSGGAGHGVTGASDVLIKQKPPNNVKFFEGKSVNT
jgi:hypothetical protein